MTAEETRIEHIGMTLQIQYFRRKTRIAPTAESAVQDPQLTLTQTGLLGRHMK